MPGNSLGILGCLAIDMGLDAPMDSKYFSKKLAGTPPNFAAGFDLLVHSIWTVPFGWLNLLFLTCADITYFGGSFNWNWNDNSEFTKFLSLISTRHLAPITSHSLFSGFPEFNSSSKSTPALNFMAFNEMGIISFDLRDSYMIEFNKVKFPLSVIPSIVTSSCIVLMIEDSWDFLTITISIGFQVSLVANILLPPSTPQYFLAICSRKGMMPVSLE